MTYSDQSYNLRIQLDTKDCELSALEIDKMERALTPLDRLIHDFPVSDLYITVIRHPRSNDFHVKTSLILSGTTLFTGDRDDTPYPAYERCLRKLMRKVEAYKARLAKDGEISKQRKGTRHEVVPTRAPDAAAIARAVEDGNYSAFREATDMYEEPIRQCVGRWIQRYPQLESQLGDSLTIGDVVEEVFLNAFEDYGNRRDSVLPSEWLESLVDPSVRHLLEQPDDEVENIRFIQTMRDAESEKRR